jgi:hypothetical protein
MDCPGSGTDVDNAGPLLDAELALAGVDVAVVEPRPNHVLVGSRAGGFHSRTIEVLDQRGVADRFLAEGQVAQVATFGTTVLDMSEFPTRHPYSLEIWQNPIERIMGVGAPGTRRGQRRPPCWFAQTATSPGSGTEATWDSPTHRALGSDRRQRRSAPGPPA